MVDMGLHNEGYVIDGKWYHKECVDDFTNAVFTVSEINHYCNKCHEKMTRMSKYIETLSGEEKQHAIDIWNIYLNSKEYQIYYEQSMQEYQEYLASLEDN